MKPSETEVFRNAFNDLTAEEILSWAVDQYCPGLVMSTAFGPGGIVLMHILYKLQIRIPVFYIDTGLLFPEVHQLRSMLEKKWGTPFEKVVPALGLEEQAERFGEKLWERDPDMCCRLRKVLPVQQYLQDKKAWITAIRANQTEFRARAKVVEWDERYQVVKINPLLNWSEEQIWDYLHRNRLPYNPLHDRGYPSIGCLPCTSKVESGGNPRDGRWKGHSKVECGVHLQWKEICSLTDNQG